MVHEIAYPENGNAQDDDDERDSLVRESLRPQPLTACRRFLVRVFFMILVGAVALIVWTACLPRISESDKTDKQANGTTTTATTTSSPFDKTHHRPFSDLQRQQVENYKGGSGLILNIHVTHHGGTTVCQTIGRLGPSPTFACMGVMDEDNVTNPHYPQKYPWRNNETAKNIGVVRQYFHMISWEWNAVARPKPPLNETNWEDPNLVSVFIMREPLSRLLSGFERRPHGINGHVYSVEKNRSKEEWWEFAKDPWWTDNYALQKLTGPDCCRGEDTDPVYLEQAKSLIKRFTIVLDMACLDQGLVALAKVLGLEITKLGSHRSHPSPKERIGHDDVYWAGTIFFTCSTTLVYVYGAVDSTRTWYKKRGPAARS